jgi:lipopolysaccharide/colanic/teichoic acid biosynthesis glycosyltransferase
MTMTVKRTLDLCVGATLFFASAPAMAAVAALIYKKMGRPILFRQTRPGKQGKPFTLYKFRTMTVDGENFGPEADATRLTPLGKTLRRLSLDELPTLWNVIRGDMSLVGPRPLLLSYLDLYTAEQARRHDVLPGITGWAQIHGRNLLSHDQKFELDVWYVDHHSLLLDLTILGKTIGLVLRRRGISAPGQATMEPFRGSKRRAQPC